MTSPQRQHYEQLETEELVRLATTDLTESARGELYSELDARGVDKARIDQAREEHILAEESQSAEERTYASRRIRFVAFMIDFAIVGFLQLGIAAISRQVEGRENSTLESFLIGVVFVGYWLFRDTVGGQSIGKRLVGIVVRDRTTNAPCGVMQSIWRNMPLMFLVDWLFIFGRKHARFGDMLANTKVVRVKRLPNPSSQPVASGGA